MRDYLLFLDTEASGLPKSWSQPYSNSDNWPFSVQISWSIFKNDGALVKTENHYIGDNDFEINPTANKIHGIDRAFLDQHGESRKEFMQKLAEDLQGYQPLVSGHFMEFDYHVVSADFHRSGIANPIANLPTFCTMLASRGFVRDPSVKYLRLGELYSTLFHKPLEDQHNAMVDAKATAECFFELLQRGEITDERIEKQKQESEEPARKLKWLFFILIVILIILIISLWL